MARASIRAARNTASSYRQAESDNDEDIEQTQPTQKRSRVSYAGGSGSGSGGTSQARLSSSSGAAAGSSNGARRTGRPSGTQASSSAAHLDDSDGEDDVALPAFLSKDDIKDQIAHTPLTAHLAKSKLNMQITEYDSALSKTKNVLEYLGEAALAVEELFEDGETDVIGELDQNVRQAINAQHEMEIRQKVLQGMVNSLDNNREIVNPTQVYSETVKKALERYNAKTSRQKYVKSVAYQKFRSVIWEVHNGGTAMPSLNDFIPAEPGDEADEDVEDFEAAGVAQNFKCPLTTAILEDPVSSTLCPHSYSKQAIHAYLAMKARERRPATCPQAGCNAVLSASSLKPDAGLAKRVAVYLRRMQSQAQTQGAGGGGGGGAGDASVMATQGGTSGRSARRGAAAAKMEPAGEDAIEDVEEGSDDEEEIEID